jgi:hypothetical protein
MLYYESDDKSVKFYAVKNLYALTEYIKAEFPTAKLGENIDFYFKSGSESIELIFDTMQESSCEGWTVRPCKKPCKLMRSRIDNFGTTKNCSLPASCSILVHNSPGAVADLYYGIPLKGTSDDRNTIYIDRALNAGTTNSSTGIQTCSNELLWKRPKIKELVKLLKEISHKWQRLGIELEVDRHIIEGLEKNESDNTVRLYKILNAWIDADESVYWNTIIEAVEGIVENKAVANKIRKYLSEQKI